MLKFKIPRVRFTKKRGEGKNKLVVFRKKQIASASLVVMIAVAGYLNWSFQDDITDETISVMYNETSKKLGEAQMVTNNQDESESEEKTDKEKTKMSNNYFAQAKIDREIKRDEAIEVLESILNSTESSIEARKSAETEIFTLAEYTQKEVNAENLIKARGYGDVIVFMNDDSVSVAIESEGLSENDATVISEAVSDTTMKDIACIKIVEIAPEG